MAHDSNAVKFEAIQVLRAIAALAVLIYHVRGYAMITANFHSPVLEAFRTFGVGVNIFFAISGFLMAHLISHGYPHFLLRRAARIYPSYLVAVALVVLVRVALIGGYNQNDMLLAMTLIPGAGRDYPLNIEWTLIYEMYFYVVCAVFALRQTRRLFPVFLVLWLIFLIVASIFHVTARSPLPTLATIPFQSISAPFVLGALAYFVRARIHLPSPINIALVGICLGLMAGLDPASLGVSAEGGDFLYGTIGGVMMIAAAQTHISGASTVARIALWLGDRSYGIYLVHAATLWIVYDLILRSGLAVGLLGCFVAGGVALASGCAMGEIDVQLHGHFSTRLRGFLSAPQSGVQTPVRRASS